MLTDRPYMQGDYPRRTTSVVIWLISALIGAFVLELILLSPWLGTTGTDLVNRLVLSIPNLREWHVWTLASHSLVHSTGNPFHLLFIVLGLYFVGRELEPILGARRFLGVYAGTILLGGLTWAAVNWSHGGTHIGAGSALIGFLVVLAGVHPALQVSMFFFPVSFNIRHVLYALLALNALGLLFYEIRGAAVPLGLTPSAQLGGMLAGWLYYRYFHANQDMDRAPGLNLPSWLRNWRRPPAKAQPGTSLRPKPAPKLGAEVDRILDKINSQGFGSLTDQEKRTLDEAKDLLNRN